MRMLSSSILVAVLFAAGCFIPVQQQPAQGPPASGGTPGGDGTGGGDPYGNGGDPNGGGGDPYGNGGDPYANGGGATDGAAGSSGPTTVSVTLRNSCPQTVRLFLGDKPKFGSGTNTTLSSNTITNYTMEPGDMVWLTDDSENGLASATVSASTREIEIASSCTSIDAH